MQIRYVGDDPDGVELVCSGVRYGTAKPDEVIEIPDEVYERHAWSEDLWKPVTAAKKTSKERD